MSNTTQSPTSSSSQKRVRNRAINPEEEHEDHTVKHRSFFFDYIIIQVENCLYNLPRQTLAAESDVFRDMFELPRPAAELADGSTEKRPLSLQGVAKIDWERLLEVMFHTIADRPQFSLNEWTSVLKLATMWEMAGIREKAIEEISSSTFDDEPAQKIAIARKFDIEELIQPCILQLVARAEPLTADDINYLGSKFTAEIAAIRESCSLISVRHGWRIGEGRGQVIPALQPDVDTPERRELLNLIKQHFKDLF